MARSIPEDTIRHIKNAANIVDVVSESVVLKKAGKNYTGLCPFHAEKTPSFTVSVEKQIFYCFGCQTGGNVFSFLMKHDGLSFPDAVRSLAGRYGVEVPDYHLTPAEKKRISEKERLYRVNEEAMGFFKQMLHDPRAGQHAMTYLLGRGMTRKIIESHHLGYSPNRWDGLLRYFQRRKVPADELVKTGLVVPRKDRSGHYDRFRHRVMFPIFNLNQQVIGFGGRVMGDDLPKYLNSPETPVYNKRRSLYGIDKAKSVARTEGKVYLVEGYFDVLAMQMYGIDNAVATLGTALTAEHADLLKGMVGSGYVVLVYDSDLAGIKAAHRSIGVFEERALDARIMVLPQGDDPDSYLRAHGPDRFLKAAAHASAMVPFLIDSAIRKHGLKLEGKVKVVNAMQDALAAVQDTVARTLYIKQMAEKLDIDESAILERIRQTNASQIRRPTQRRNGGIERGMAGGGRLEQQIVAMMLRYPVMNETIADRNVLDHFEDATLKSIAQRILQRSSADQAATSDLVSSVEDPHYRNLMAKLAMREDHWDRLGCDRLLAQFEARQHRRSNSALQRQIEAAEKENNIDLLCKLLKEKQKQAGKGLNKI